MRQSQIPSSKLKTKLGILKINDHKSIKCSDNCIRKILQVTPKVWFIKAPVLQMHKYTMTEEISPQCAFAPGRREKKTPIYTRSPWSCDGEVISPCAIHVWAPGPVGTQSRRRNQMKLEASKSLDSKACLCATWQWNRISEGGWKS